MTDSGPLPTRVLLGVAVVSLLQLAFELLLVKLSSYEFGALSFGVVGLALLGVSLAAPLARLLGGGSRAVDRALAALPVLALAAGHVAFSWRHEITAEADTVQRILGGGVVGLALLAVSSVPVFVPMAERAGSAPRLIGVSLLGGAVGTPVALALLQAVGDAGTYAALVALCALSAPLASTRGARAAVVAASLCAGAVAAAHLPAADRAAHPDSLYVETNAISRIDVVGERDRQFKTAGVNAGTPLFVGRFADPEAPITRRLSAAPFRLQPQRALILGSGGGQNVAQALALGVPDIVAVEINGMIPAYMQANLTPETDVYRQPGVTLVVDEGREAAASLALQAPFDLVYVPIATLFGSSGHTFTMTYLMTEEALAQYLGALAPGGVVAVYSPGMLSGKVTAALARALRARGVADPAPHLALIGEGERFLVVARPDAPLTDAERATLAGSEPVADTAAELRAGAALRPLTDDNPFLYNDTWTPTFLRTIYGWSVRSLRAGFGLGLGALVLVGLAALWRRPPTLSVASAAGPLAAGAALGLAFSTWQTVVMQRLGFLVGHPALATAVVLPCTLVGAGVGSWLASRIDGPRAAQLRLGAGALLVAGIGLVALVPPAALVQPGWPRALRFALAVGASTAPFALMGSFFPSVIERARARHPDLVGPVWLVNGVASVVGSLLVLYGAMLVGFSAVMAVPAALYAAVTVWEAGARGPWADRVDRGAPLAIAAVLAAAALALEVSASSLR